MPRRLEAKWRTRLEKASPCLPTMSRSPSPGCCLTYTQPVCRARCRISVLRAKNRNRGCRYGALRIHEIALNKILRKIWHLPPRSHTAIVHCVTQVDTISNLLNKRFQSFLSRSLSSSSPLIKTIFNESIYSFTGYNGHKHIRVFNNADFCIASTIRLIRSIHGLYSPLESTIVTSC